jgi:hypothetical protein
MINKIYKSIHNKYSMLFKFIFYLRHLFAIFFISVVLFLLTPHFFDFQKKDKIIKNYLLDSYGLTLNKYESIKYTSLPKPVLTVRNADLETRENSIQMSVESLNIYPKLISIYNLQDFNTNKVVLNKNKILLEDSELNFLFNYIYNLKNKISLKNLNIKIKKNNLPLINLEKINFSNYGYDRNIVRGVLFGKRFKILISDDYNKINFKLLKTGVSADINFDEIKKNSIISGIFKSKLLNSNIKFDFEIDDKKLKIYNSYFRNKNISFNNESIATYKPFFYLNSIFQIEDINFEFLKKLKINKIFESKELIKKLNTKNRINFKSKKFSQSPVDKFNLNINLAYGRLTYLKKISISDHFFTCKGDINLLEEYPILRFNCSIVSKDKKKLLKEFLIKYKKKNEIFKLNTKGSINIFNNKINFENIEVNQNYKSSKEDLDYFKQSFETILFDKDFLGIFDLKKIKEFILAVS